MPRMDLKPKIYLSADHSELKAARTEMEETLRLLGIGYVVQEEHPAGHDITAKMLTTEMAPFPGIIQLVGRSYGRKVAGAVEDPSFSRFCSDYAQKKDIPIWYLLLDDNLCGNSSTAEDASDKSRQNAYRADLLTADKRCFPISNMGEIEVVILGIQHELMNLCKPRGNIVQFPPVAARSAALPPVSGHSPVAATPSAAAANSAAQSGGPSLLSDFIGKVQEVQQGDVNDEIRRESEQYANLASVMGKSVDDARSLIRTLAQNTLSDPSESFLEQAKAAYLLKQYSQAESLALQAVTILKDPQLKIEAYYQAGHAAGEQVQSLRALEHYRTAASYTREEYAPVEWARVQHMIAYTLDDLGRTNEAEEILCKVIRVREQSLSPEHPDTIVSRNNLAMVYAAQGMHQDEERERRIVLAIRERVLGPDHQGSLRTRSRLADALNAQGKYDEASEEYERVKEICERKPNTPEVSARPPADSSDPVTGYREALTSTEAAHGPNHPDTLTRRHQLADALDTAGKAAEAEKEYRRLLKQSEELYGSSSPDTLSQRHTLAIFLYSQKNYAEAEKELRTVLVQMEAVYGKQHHKVFRCRYNFAACLQKQKKTALALVQAKMAYQGWSRALGENHSDSQDARQLIEALKKTV
jgi:tetratricopeptide (TPR) repeat protein